MRLKIEILKAIEENPSINLDELYQLKKNVFVDIDNLKKYLKTLSRLHLIKYEDSNDTIGSIVITEEGKKFLEQQLYTKS